MKNKARQIDIAKNCAIVLLFFSAVFLLLKTTTSGQGNLTEGLKNLLGGKPDTEAVAQTGGEETAYFFDPVFILITAQDGSHYAVKYDNETKKKLITAFSSSLGEALGSSGEPQELTITEWQKALSATSVFFDYLYPQPLAAIASSLGYEIRGSASQKTARRFLLGSNEGSLALYFISEDDGKIYSCDTALSFSALEPKIAECPIGDANYAFELGEEYDKLDPYFIFSHESKPLRAVTVSSPVRENFDGSALLKYFGMNSKTTSTYTEASGSVVYVDGDKSLRIESSGRVLFQASGNSGKAIAGEASGLTVSDCIAACSEIVKNSIGRFSGEGTTGLIKVAGFSTPSSSVLSFGYFLDGVPVTLPEDSYAASFKISDGKIVRAELYFRSYAFSGSPVIALPEKQATAIAEKDGGEPVLTYEDKNDSVICTWINK